MHTAPHLVHVPTHHDSPAVQLASSWRAQGTPHEVRTHPLSVSRYAIGDAGRPVPVAPRFRGVGYE